MKPINYTKILEGVGQMLIKEMAEELDSQGHRASGSLINSMESEVVKTVSGNALIVKGNRYGIYLDRGVKGKDIAYYPGSGRKRSKYITGLIKWIALKGMASGSKAVRSLAFAIAKTQGTPKLEGMPTNNRRARGKATGWITDTLKKQQNEILNKLIGVMGRELNLRISENVKKTNRDIKL